MKGENKDKGKEKGKKSKKHGFLVSSFVLLAKMLWFVIKLPYFLFLGIYHTGKFISRKSKERRIKKKRESIKSVYSDFNVIHSNSGEYKKWEKKIFGAESKIGIILGARGSGKTAFGVKFLENVHAKEQKSCYALGFKEEDFPSWIKVVSDVSEIKNNSFVLIDESGILFSSRNSMSDSNKFLSNLILVARHKNLNILFISQNSSNLDVNILRQADYLVLKPSSLLQKDFERKIVQKIYQDSAENFEKFKDVEGLTHIYSSDFNGFVSNPLPSFWGSNISKSFR